MEQKVAAIDAVSDPGHDAAVELIRLQSKFNAMQHSLQQIANLDPDSFNSSQRAIQMAKTALLIPVPK